MGHYTDDKVGPRTTVILGNVRAGRDVETRQKMMSEISAAWEQVTGQPANQLVVAFTKVKSENLMEFGLVIPEPGDEDAWMAKNKVAMAAAQSGN